MKAANERRAGAWPAAAGEGAVRLVFIDGSVAGAQALAAGAHAGVEVVVLAPGRDGVRQIADHLERRGIRDAAAIDIVAHGANGVIWIGGTWLCETAIAS